MRGRSGKTYKINVYKRSVLVEALNINNIDKIIGTYKGDKESIIDHLAKLPPEELIEDTKNPYYVKLAINRKEELIAENTKSYVHPQKIINELTKIKKQSNPRYREKVQFNKRNNLDYKGNPKNTWLVDQRVKYSVNHLDVMENLV